MELIHVDDSNDLIEYFANETAKLLELTSLIVNDGRKEYTIIAKVKDGVSDIDLVNAGQNPGLKFVKKDWYITWYENDKHHTAEGMLSSGYQKMRDITKRALEILRDEYLGWK